MEKLNVKSLFFVLAGLFLLCLQGCNGEGVAKEVVVAKPVKTMIVSGESELVERAFPGTVVAGEKAEIGFRVAGQLSELLVKAGQHVKRGQIIATLDKNDFQTKLRGLDSKLLGARASLQEAKLNYKRNSVLLKDDIVSKATYDSALSVFENARAQVKQLEQEREQARLNLEYTVLRAPFDGVVAQTYVKNFENVQAQQYIVRLDDVGNLDVEVQVPELVIAILQAKNTKMLKKPSVRFAAMPNKLYEGELKEFETTANEQTSTYTVTVSLPQPEGVSIYSGMTAEVIGYFPGGANGNAIGLRVPVSAVAVDSADTPFVWIVQKDNTVKRVSVELGSMQQNEYILKSGLKSGMQIVTAGVHYLKDGQSVRVLQGEIGE
ncbi:efflux RND transporter periplasmic adaptor subunit [Halodesulfovibrio marinisediminis]|uniref:RND family efflux transporter, MFP subunit n=1 Tax=Halodesulfovibrio marinisediminis DSM 17456 TaxID=1121457 RepID=A0A1N6III7_9BACT|nr:efflux RND transporter periplasmic adaptor subunit [Halodesulfovibrio marinisediminis]SIO31816.1 RND family efflux transporter, MFP subunit [Halodesulfovibrio marinisediminis DSM 17456]